MEITPSYCRCKTLVLGCGNVLLGDDGFGPRVADELQHNYFHPDTVKVVNAGSRVRNILFDVTLSETKPERIIIVDAIDDGRSAGEIFELPINEIPEKKIDDFSMHQIPTSNLLKELKEFCNVEVTIIVCQIENSPKEVTDSVSEKISEAIPVACERIDEIIKNDCKNELTY